MNITATPNTNQPIMRAANQPPNNTPPQDPTPPQDTWQTPKKDDASNVWKALRAVPSALAGAVICGVGAGAASLVDVPRVTVSAAQALAKTPKIGTNLKVMTGVLMPFAAVASMVLSPVAGALYGLCTGFVNGAERGVGAAAKMAAHDIKTYHNEACGNAVKWLKDEQTANLPEGETPYDVSLGGAAKGLVGGAINGTIGGVAATGLAVGYAIPAFVRAEAEMWKSDIPLPFKVVGTPIVPVAVGLAACLAPVAGALYGLGMGAKDSYSKGIGESVVHTGETVKDAVHGLNKVIFNS